MRTTSRQRSIISWRELHSSKALSSKSLPLLPSRPWCAVPQHRQGWSNLLFSPYLMAFYLFWSERHGTGVGSRWAFMGLAVKLGVSVSVTAKICLRPGAHGTFTCSRWVFVSLLGRVFRSLTNRQLICLPDRDAGRWKVDQAEIQRRRESFWELYSYDFLQV